ncbi:MAG: GDP-L-fucose synthase [Thermoplasmata archaeon]
MSFWHGKRTLVTGGHGFLGSFIVEKLINDRGARKEDVFVPSSKELDLRVWDNCQRAVKGIDIVIHVAGRGGGIGYNRSYPGSLFYDNIIMNTQMMEAARLAGVKKFVSIGTVCSYPKYTPVPFREENLWEGYPEETNASYGLSKKMSLVQSQAYRKQYGFNSIHLLMANLYGPRDNFDPEQSHVIPALIKKFADAVRNKEKCVVLWGSGNASREFLYVDDAAEGVLLAAEKYDNSEPVNLGAGYEITIEALAVKIASIMGFVGEIVWDTSKPDGQPRRTLDVSKAEKYFGFTAKTSLDDGLKKTIDWYLRHGNGRT